MIDRIDLDAPIFDPNAFRLNDEQAGIIATARQLGQTRVRRPRGGL
jgi:hypothetical protein